MHTRTQTRVAQTIFYKNAMHSDAEKLTFATSIHVFSSPTKSKLLWNELLLSYDSPTENKLGLHCYDVLDFWLNPISNQIFQNEF